MIRRLAKSKVMVRRHHQLHKERLLRTIIARIRESERAHWCRELSLENEERLYRYLELTTSRGLELLVQQQGPLLCRAVLLFAERNARRVGPFERFARAIAELSERVWTSDTMVIVGVVAFGFSALMGWHGMIGLFFAFVCVMVPVLLLEALQMLYPPRRAQEIDLRLGQGEEIIDTTESIAQVGAVSVAEPQGQGALSEVDRQGEPVQTRGSAP